MIEQKQPPTWLQQNAWYLAFGLYGCACLWWDLEPILLAKISDKIHLPFGLDNPINKRLR